MGSSESLERPASMSGRKINFAVRSPSEATRTDLPDEVLDLSGIQRAYRAALLHIEVHALKLVMKDGRLLLLDEDEKQLSSCVLETTGSPLYEDELGTRKRIATVRLVRDHVGIIHG